MYRFSPCTGCTRQCQNTCPTLQSAPSYSNISGFCPDVTWNPGRLKLPSSTSLPKKIIVPDTITWKKRTRSALVHLIISRRREEKSQVHGWFVCHPEDLFKFVVSKDNSSVECAHNASPSYIRIHSKAQMSLAVSPV